MATSIGTGRIASALIDGLATGGIVDIAPADGAFYVYAHVPHLTTELGIDSLTLCRRWMSEIGVAATSGIDFDLRRGHEYVRFSYAGHLDHIERGVHTARPVGDRDATRAGRRVVGRAARRPARRRHVDRARRAELRPLPRRLRRRRHQGRAADRRQPAQHGLARSATMAPDSGGSSSTATSERSRSTSRSTPTGTCCWRCSTTPTCSSRTPDPGTLERLGHRPGRAARPQRVAGDHPGVGLRAGRAVRVTGRIRHDRRGDVRPRRAHRRTGRQAAAPPIALTDEVTGVAAAFATMVALYSGVGQVVDVNLLETMFQLMGPLASLFAVTGEQQARLGAGLPVQRAARYVPVQRRRVGGRVDVERLGGRTGHGAARRRRRRAIRRLRRAGGTPRRARSDHDRLVRAARPRQR